MSTKISALTAVFDSSHFGYWILSVTYEVLSISSTQEFGVIYSRPIASQTGVTHINFKKYEVTQ